MSGDFAQDVVNRTAQRMAAGEIEPSIRDGLVAAGLLDKRSERDADRDLWAKVTLALTGQVPVRVLPQPDPDLVDFTTELDVLNNGGSYEEARAAGARAKERLLLSAGDD